MCSLDWKNVDVNKLNRPTLAIRLKIITFISSLSVDKNCAVIKKKRKDVLLCLLVALCIPREYVVINIASHLINIGKLIAVCNSFVKHWTNFFFE